MHYPAAKKGVASILKAEIIYIISAVAMGVALILLFTGLTGAIIGTIILAVAFVAELVAFIINLIGLHKAGNDEKSFKTGFIFALIGIVVSVVGGILSFIIGGITPDIVNLLSTAIEIIIVLYVCNGISALAGKIKGQQPIAVKAKKLMVVVIVLFTVSIIFSLISGGLVNASPLIVIIFSLCYIIAKLVAYITYLVLLAQAKAIL